MEIEVKREKGCEKGLKIKKKEGMGRLDQKSDKKKTFQKGAFEGVTTIRLD